MAQRLHATAYSGRITLEGYLGKFCVVDAESPKEADPRMPLLRCKFYSGSEEYMLALGDELAASMKTTLLQAGFSAKQVFTMSYGAERVSLPSSKPQTAGEWNRIARENNKVVLRLDSQ
jgi:hypothetical protein